MPLLDLKTNLKDLKFGRDERGGGNSGQPYVATRIPATNEALQTGFSNTQFPLLGAGAGAAIGAIGGSVLGAAGPGALVGAAVGLGIGVAGGSTTGNDLKVPQAGTGGPDFLLRGGTLLPNAIADDETRLFKFFKSTEGLLFTVKQNLLSRIAVRTQASPTLLNDGVYTPISSLIEAAGIPFGIHVNKQGVNPFERVTYFDVLKNSNSNIQNDPESTEPLFSNRLFDLYWVKILDNQSNPFTTGLGVAAKSDSTLVISYQGGPDAPLGIGKTNIKYATDIFGSPLKVKDASNDYGDTLSYNQLLEAAEETNAGIAGYITQIDFREKLRENSNLQPNLISNSPSYDPGKGKTIEQRVRLGDPGNSSGKNLTSYTNGATEDTTSKYYGAASENSYDKINALPIYQSSSPDSDNGNDLVKFRIGVINNNSPSTKTYLHFRAFLNQISDNYSAEWQDTRYIGRGEKFYTYMGFDRKVSLSWTVAAQSKAELIPMYQKLNYLASVCAPDYSKNGYMRGNIVTLTIGGYFYEQPGIITGFSYEMNDDNSTWEIGIPDSDNIDPFFDPSVKELPHLIKVSGFNFIPIHNFVPRLQQNTFDNGILTGFGEERYIALAAGTGKNNNNYDDINYLLPIPSPPPTVNTPRFS